MNTIAPWAARFMQTTYGAGGSMMFDLHLSSFRKSSGAVIMEVQVSSMSTNSDI